MTSRISGGIKRRPLFAYFVLAFAITWMCWIPTEIVAAMQGYVLPGAGTFVQLIQLGFVNAQHIAISVLFSIGVYGPFLAAIIVTSAEKGKNGLHELFGRIKKWRVGIKWYLALIIVPLVINFVTVGVSILFVGPSWLTLVLVVPIQYTIIFILYMLFTSGFEEPGWRGYALPKLQEKYDPGKSSVLLGFVWGLWHLPFVVYTNYPWGIGPGILAALFYAFSLIPIALIYTWFYDNTGSVLIPILFHTTGNVANTYVLGMVAQPIVGTILPLITLVVALILVRTYMGKVSPKKGEVSKKKQ
nr:type II CAAX endopeptidase family protein [Candidatus Njordarchaeota archaeon]